MGLKYDIDQIDKNAMNTKKQNKKNNDKIKN